MYTFLSSKMVYLRDMKNQWPWVNDPTHNFSDKEIYTHTVNLEDASNTWRVPVLPPMGGYAYTGIRVSIFGKDTQHTVKGQLVLGETEKPVFGMPWDIALLSNGSWTPLGFPITHKIIALTEDGLDFIIEHTDSCWGQVSFVAQRFEDLLEDESDISYAFLNHRTDKVEWILNDKNYLYKPRPNDEPVYRKKVKIIPSILRLLDPKRADWTLVEKFRDHLNVPVPLLA